MTTLTGPGRGLLLLGLVGLVLVALAATTARPPVGAVPDRDGYLDRWSATHGGYDPRTGSAWLRGWLSLVHALAGPLARRGVQPGVVTLSSVWVAAVVVALAALGGGWAVLAGVLCVASAVLDSLDGCLAVLEDRATRWGYVLDSVVDRGSDALYLVAAVALGCPPGLAAVTGFGCFLMEYLRARAGNAGGDEVGRITVAERPTRVIVLAPTIAVAGVLDGPVAALGVAVLLVLTVVGLGQLTVAVRRQLRELPDEGERGAGPPGRSQAP